MGYIIYILYRIFFVPVFIIGVNLYSLFNKKLKARIEADKKIKSTLKNKLKKKRGQKRILFHCSSLGEWEQAAPLAEIIKKKNPNINIIVSFFSISGFNHIKECAYVDEKVLLPFDQYSKACDFFNWLKPDLWIISAYDIWPNHIKAAKKCKIPVVIISATLASTSARHKGLSGTLNSYIFKTILAIYSRALNDTKRFLKIYPYPEKIKTFGDTRADRVYEKSMLIKKSDSIPVFKNIKENDIVFTIGSCWPADEKRIIPGIISLLKKHSNLKVVVVPHEIKEPHIAALENEFSASGISTERYSSFSQTNGSDSNVVIINAVGLLAKLYKDSQIAYIGGSFGKGVHNVLEPAVFGMPVLFGPNHHNSQEALNLKEINAAFCIKNQAEFVEIADKLVSDNQYRTKCSGEALAFVRGNLGASGKIYQHLGKTFDYLN